MTRLPRQVVRVSAVLATIHVNRRKDGVVERHACAWEETARARA
jgi:hypothetical protein